MPLHELTCEHAARNGNLDMLVYAHLNGCKLNDTATAAVTGKPRGIACLKYAHENGGKWDARTCAAAARAGALDCLRYAHENGCPWDRDTTKAAAMGGHLDCLKYAHENGCAFHQTISYSAAKNIECLRYVHQQGAPWNSSMIMKHAASGGFLECVKYVCEHGGTVDDVDLLAVRGGHLAIMKYAHENGAPWDAETCKVAAMRGFLECLRYAHENGCGWNADTCAYAASENHLDCLKYILHSFSTSFYNRYIIALVLIINRYAKENGCPWDFRVCDFAARRKHPKILEYAKANGCKDYANGCLIHYPPEQTDADENEKQNEKQSEKKTKEKCRIS